MLWLFSPSLLTTLVHLSTPVAQPASCVMMHFDSVHEPSSLQEMQSNVSVCIPFATRTTCRSSLSSQEHQVQQVSLTCRSSARMALHPHRADVPHNLTLSSTRVLFSTLPVPRARKRWCHTRYDISSLVHAVSSTPGIFDPRVST